MNILDLEFVKGFIRMCNDGFNQGWHERNGGNLTYRIKEEDLKDVRDLLNTDGEWLEIGTEVPSLANEHFLVTGSGKYFRNVILDPESNIAIILIDETGTKYQIQWGLKMAENPQVNFLHI